MADTSPLDTLREWMEKGVEGYTVNWTTEPGTSDLVKWRAFRQSNKAQLQTMSSWKQGRKYVVDPLPERMSLAFADFLFNEPPLCVTASEEDQTAANSMLTENNWGSRLRVAEDICVSEREVWWRIYKDPRQLDYPILDWTSRINVVPYMVGETVLACAFITDMGKLSSEENAPRYRLIEYHEEGRVQNVLYETKEESSSSGGASGGASGSKGVGTEVPLQTHPVAEMIEEEWSHGLPILAGRIRNEEWMTSIYDGIEDMLLELNETWSVDGENFRLAGKKRAVLDKKYANEAGEADAGEEILWAEDDFNELDGGDKAPFKILEYTYDADGTADRLERLERAALTRVGLARQLVDANASEGLAQTGTALRVRLMPTVASIRGKAKEWGGQLPKIITLMQQVDANEQWEHDNAWTTPESKPSVTLQDPFPADAKEEADRHSTLVGSELESLEQAVAELRPNWTHQRRMLEVCRILANRDGYALDDEGAQVTPERAPEFTSTEVSGAQEGKSAGGTPTSRPRQPGARVGAGAAEAAPVAA